MSIKLPGAHRNLRKRGGRHIAYWQAWRGGPSIGRFEGETRGELERAEIDGAAQLAEKYAQTRQRDVPKDLLAGLVAAYKSSPSGLLKSGESTRKEWSRFLDDIVELFGTMPVVALKSKGFRRQLIKWRDSMAETPRTADYAVQVFGRLCSWGMSNELCDANPAKGIDHLYDGDRSGEIVEPEELSYILSRATPAAARFFRLAAATGIRRADLRNLKWSDVDDNSIEFGTRKSKKKARPIMPLLDEGRAVLEECRTAQRLAEEEAIAKGRTPVKSIFILTTERGKQWSKDGPTGAWIRARAGAEPEIEKHLHDLRGNFATLLMRKGINDERIAFLMGWKREDVERIRRRYVDRNAIALDLAERLSRQS